jgi:hypothetical protein
MSSIDDVRHSVETSVEMNLFKNKEDATFAHMFRSISTSFPLFFFKRVGNVDVGLRFQKTAVKAYPLQNRPRGQEDITSVKRFQKQIQNKKELAPVWLYKNKKNKYILLDGEHKLVASFIEGNKTINAFVIEE